MEARWKEMEGICGNIPTKALIGDQKFTAARQKELKQLVSFKLLTWFDVVKKLNMTNQTRVLRWAAFASEYIPNQIDSTFKN